MSANRVREDRESYPPCTATAEEIRHAIEEKLDDDPEILVEDNVPMHIDDPDDISDWMDERIDEIQLLLGAPSAEVDAVLLAGRDRALAWMQDWYPPSAFLDAAAAHEELLLCCCWEFSSAFFRGDFAEVTARQAASGALQ